MRSEREKVVTRNIILAIGAWPDLLVFENGTAPTEKTSADGSKWRSHNGLGPGTPDLIVGWEGRMIGLEVKDPDTGRPTPSQLKEQKRWHMNGLFYAFVNSPEEAIAALERSKEGKLE